MKFISEIKQIFNCDEISISERMSTVETTSSFNIDIHQIDKIVSLLWDNVFSDRDKAILTVINESNDFVTISNKEFVNSQYLKFINSLDSEETVTAKLQIDKFIKENKFSIYDFNAFSEDLLKKSCPQVLQWFSDLLRNREYLIFEVYDDDIAFSTGTMGFVSNRSSFFTPSINRIQRLNACRETAYFYNMNIFEVIPDDFKIEGIEHTPNALKPFFGQLTTILALAYVGSSSSIVDSILNIQINGQRTITYTLNLEDIPDNIKWTTIYSWIYTDGNSTDKSLIAHNVISLHCKYADLLNIDDTVFDSIKSNYRLYLRDNVGQYLELKREISKFIQDVVAQVGEYTTSILSKFKTNLIAIFAFLFTIILTRIGTTQKWDEIFTRHTMYLIEVVLGGSLGYLIICFFEAKYKLKKTKKAYNELKLNYNTILSEAEIREAFNEDRLLKDVESSVKKGMAIWSILWGTSLIIAILIIEKFTNDKGIVIWLWNKLSP